MSLLPKTSEEFSQKEYWDKFFKKRGDKAFEWYGEYPELCIHIHKYIKLTDKILIVGCGNSTLGRDLYDVLYKNITNIDISQVAIRQMLQANEKSRPDLKFLVMDALNMTFENESFNVVLDKGTLDALMPDEKEETVANVEKYLNEITRVLTNGGRYMCISLLQEHILRKIVNYFPSNNYFLRIVRCFDAEKKAEEQGESSMPVFMVIATKFKKIPSPILEVNMGIEDKMQRLNSTSDMLSLVKQVQEASFICTALQRSKLGNKNNEEIFFELFQPGEDKPRYTVYVVEKEFNYAHMQYAAFIVPQGREAEWLFAKPKGRKKLADMTKYNRLAVISLHRHQKYESLDAVKDELGSIVKNLAPATKRDKILFLSVGLDLGNRDVRYEGWSESSGKYIVEDVEVDGEMFRRLYYDNSLFVIQTESKLKITKGEKVIDSVQSISAYQRFLSVGTHMAHIDNRLHIAMIGLGGGSLCNFLREFLPFAEIVGVDIDADMLEVSKKWFGLKEDNNLQVQICDGIKFLQNVASYNQTFDVIIFDVDNKNSTSGFACPPEHFLEEDVLDLVVKCLEKMNGMFILNLVLRDISLRDGIVAKLTDKFRLVLANKITEETNEVFICTNDIYVNANTFRVRFEHSCKELNMFYKKKRVSDNIDINTELNNINIYNSKTKS